MQCLLNKISLDKIYCQNKSLWRKKQNKKKLQIYPTGANTFLQYLGRSAISFEFYFSVELFYFVMTFRCTTTTSPWHFSHTWNRSKALPQILIIFVRLWHANSPTVSSGYCSCLAARTSAVPWFDSWSFTMRFVRPAQHMRRFSLGLLVCLRPCDGLMNCPDALNWQHLKFDSNNDEWRRQSTWELRFK